MARRYARHPALAAWHINNEYGCHMSECHGEASTRAWRVWLKTKYGTLDRLNAAWSTAFWSQHYYAWDEILTPRRAPYHPNPSQQLDFKRFMSDAFLELCTMERDLLRAATPDVPITTNFMGFFKPLDQSVHEFFGGAAEVVATLEDHVAMGGYGSAVLECFNEAGIKTPVIRIAWPDQFIEHASSVDYLRNKHGLTVQNLVKLVGEKLGTGTATRSLSQVVAA
jgi:hypothetical protein